MKPKHKIPSSSLNTQYLQRVSQKKKKKVESMKRELLIWLFLIVSFKVLSSSACAEDNSSCERETQLTCKHLLMSL